MASQADPPRWQTLLAFAIIYFVWGSTFLAIRVGVQQAPPLLFAAARFLIAGIVLFAWALGMRARMPSRQQWTSLLVVAFLIFVCDYGLLFWAEQRVPSGIAAVMMATIPAFMALGEITVLRTQRLTVRLAIALLIGFGGVAVLMSRSVAAGANLGAVVDRKGAVALLVGSLSWSVASVLIRKLPMPESKVLSSGAQMVAGGAMLAIASAGFGEWHAFHPATVAFSGWLALAYLTVFGSIVGFTAFVWLMAHQSPTRVGTYAYVNPIVAVLLGALLGGEALNVRTLLGSALVLLSVVVVVTAPRLAAVLPRVQQDGKTVPVHSR